MHHHFDLVLFLKIMGIFIAINIIMSFFLPKKSDRDIEKEKEKEKRRLFFGNYWYYLDKSYYPTGPANPNFLNLPDWVKTAEKSLHGQAIDGDFFQPRAFWEQSMDDQLIYLKDEILSCNLLEIVKSHYDKPNTSYPSIPSGKPYTPEEEDAFRKAVWPKIQKFIIENHLPSLTEEQFYDSLIFNMEHLLFKKKKAPADAPLIRHFARYLCPLWKMDSSNGHLKQYPSWFEMFIIGDKNPDEFMK